MHTVKLLFESIPEVALAIDFPRQKLLAEKHSAPKRGNPPPQTQPAVPLQKPQQRQLSILLPGSKLFKRLLVVAPQPRAGAEAVGSRQTQARASQQPRHEERGPGGQRQARRAWVRAEKARGRATGGGAEERGAGHGGRFGERAV